MRATTPAVSRASSVWLTKNHACVPSSLSLSTGGAVRPRTCERFDEDLIRLPHVVLLVNDIAEVDGSANICRAPKQSFHTTADASRRVVRLAACSAQDFDRTPGTLFISRDVELVARVEPDGGRALRENPVSVLRRLGCDWEASRWRRTRDVGPTHLPGSQRGRQQKSQLRVLAPQQRRAAASPRRTGRTRDPLAPATLVCTACPSCLAEAASAKSSSSCLWRSPPALSRSPFLPPR